MNEMIKEMKNNMAKFGNLDKPEKATFLAVGKENCDILMDSGRWVEAVPHTEFVLSNRYRIKAGYQPEPIERCEVGPTNKGNGEYFGYKRQHDGISRCLCEATFYPDFMGYEYEDGTKTPFPRQIKTVRPEQPAETPKYVLFRNDK